MGSVTGLYLGTAARALSGVAFYSRISVLSTDHVVWNDTVEPLAYACGFIHLKNTLLDGEAVPFSTCFNSHLPLSDHALAARDITLQENSPEEALSALKLLLSHGDLDESWQTAKLGASRVHSGASSMNTRCYSESANNPGQ